MPRMPGRPSKLSRMTAQQSEVYESALHTISLMRRQKMSLAAAAQEAGTTPATVVRLARGALRRVRGQWKVKPRDRLERRLRLYDTKGSYWVTVQSSTSASRISDYDRAVNQFVHAGDLSKLQRFEGRFIVDAQGTRHRFLTDPDAIRRLARARVLGFDSIY